MQMTSHDFDSLTVPWMLEAQIEMQCRVVSEFDKSRGDRLTERPPTGL